MLIQIGTRASLLDDARRFQTKARAAGVNVTYVEHPDVIHMWLVFDPEIPESQAAFRLIGDFCKQHLARLSTK